MQTVGDVFRQEKFWRKRKLDTTMIFIFVRKVIFFLTLRIDKYTLKRLNQIQRDRNNHATRFVIPVECDSMAYN